MWGTQFRTGDKAAENEVSVSSLSPKPKLGASFWAKGRRILYGGSIRDPAGLQGFFNGPVALASPFLNRFGGPPSRWMMSRTTLAETGFVVEFASMGAISDSETLGHSASARPTSRVTISVLADALGMAKGTVSRALNDYPDISASTKQRVAAKARAMGYSPLTHAQAIKTGRTRSLGLVLQLEQHDAQSPFLKDFLGGLTQSASREGWTLTLATAFSANDGLSVTRRLIAERKADGFVLPRTLHTDPRIELLRREEVPFVLYGRTGDPDGCAWFDIEGEAAMAEGVLRLAHLGHRRIGFVSADPAFNYARLRRKGYLEGLAQAGIPVDDRLIAEPSRTASVDRQLDALLSLENPPTALLCATDQLALSTVRVLKTRGLRPGRDMSLIGYDGMPEGQWLDPTLSTFVVDQAEAGARLAALLIARIRGATPETLRETTRAKYREGGTTARKP